MKMPGRDNKIAVVVGTVTDDVRIQDIPKLKVSPPVSVFFFWNLLNSLFFSTLILFKITERLLISCVASQICALRVTDGARSRILKAGGQLMTFDQLALASPKGQGTVLLSGN